jgi:glutamine amidotransferase
LSAKIAIVDFSMGNLHTVARRLRSLGAEIDVTRDPSVVSRTSHIVLPGVGHFGAAMADLEHTGMASVIRERVLDGQSRVLGICLGMQLLCGHSEEGDVRGLGFIDCRVERLPAERGSRFRNPHVGWNSVEWRDGRCSEPTHRYYFAHSFAVQDVSADSTLATTNYGVEFVAAVRAPGVLGYQFHPEKSRGPGLELLAAWLDDR